MKEKLKKTVKMGSKESYLPAVVTKKEITLTVLF